MWLTSLFFFFRTWTIYSENTFTNISIFPYVLGPNFCFDQMKYALWYLYQAILSNFFFHLYRFCRKIAEHIHAFTLFCCWWNWIHHDQDKMTSKTLEMMAEYIWIRGDFRGWNKVRNCPDKLEPRAQHHRIKCSRYFLFWRKWKDCFTTLFMFKGRGHFIWINGLELYTFFSSFF